ncbi:hypothetical protein HUG17_0761 [Dermatophagoides farinae]|uniref:Uncharacterized protein n=1 Tax=Dermatophagoides farinae TaxID=6954 RepID=A0A9D4P781_DERFA|nr:hypothetical protein HUG17_0761 [Dermatophagoides farinae]
MNLNNPTRPRQLLSKQAITASSSSMLKSKICPENPPSSIKQSMMNNEFQSSSSCVSLYETIAEYCEPPSISVAPSPQSMEKQQQRKYSSTKTNLCMTNTKFQPNSSNSNCWKNKRRSSVSVLLFGNNNNNNGEQQQQQQLINSESQKQKLSPTHVTHYDSYSQPCHRSSDDILMMSSSKSNQNTTSRIYENVQNTRNQFNYHKHNNHHHHHHHIFPDPTRKLTKDSGYESSSSTLVSVARGPTANNNYQHHSSMLNMITSSSGYGILQRSNDNRNQTIIIDHSKSDSIDSNLSHKSFDSPTNYSLSHSINGHHSLSSLPSPSSCSPETPERGERIVQPQEAMEIPESPPPTPPIRYSSLPENYPITEKISPTEFKSINYCDQQSEFNYSTEMRINSESSNNDDVHWSYNLYPKMRRKKQQQQLQLEENPYDNQIELSLPPTQLPRSQKNQYSPPSSVAYGGYPSSQQIPPPSATQIVRSHRVQQVIRQETKQYSDDSGSQTFSLVKNSQPPALPPKSSTNTSPKNIKEIQKRAVYEFYLRQKEKKKNRNGQQAVAAGENQNLHSSSPQILKQTTATTYVNDQENQDDDNIIEFKEIKAKIDEINNSNDSQQLQQQQQPEYHHSSINDFPLPPPPSLDMAILSSSSNGQHDIDDGDDNNNGNDNNKKLLSSMYSLFKRLGLDLKLFWPSLDFKQLIPMLILVFNRNETDIDGDEGTMIITMKNNANKTMMIDYEDDDEEEEELLHIDQIRRYKNGLLSRMNLLQMESNRIAKDLSIFERKIGQFIHQKLNELDSNLSHKMEILCVDMIRIIRLIFSIQQQIKNVDFDVNDKQQQQQDDDDDEMKKNERLLQLNGQLNRAHNLSVAIQQRCNMFINRILQRSFDKKNNNNNHHQWSSEQLFKKITMMMTINDNNVHHDDDIVLQQDNDDDRIIKNWLENQDHHQSLQPQTNNMVVDDDDCSNDKKIFIWSLSQLTRSYLKHLELLNVQQQIIDALIIYYQQQQHA